MLGQNAALNIRGDQPLYCFPPKVTANGEFYKSILEDQIRTSSAQGSPEEVGKVDIGLVLLTGLQESFPGPSNQTTSKHR